MNILIFYTRESELRIQSYDMPKFAKKLGFEDEKSTEEVPDPDRDLAGVTVAHGARSLPEGHQRSEKRVGEVGAPDPAGSEPERRRGGAAVAEEEEEAEASSSEG